MVIWPKDKAGLEGIKPQAGQEWEEPSFMAGCTSFKLLSVTILRSYMFVSQDRTGPVGEMTPVGDDTSWRCAKSTHTPALTWFSHGAWKSDHIHFRQDDEFSLAHPLSGFLEYQQHRSKIQEECRGRNTGLLSLLVHVNISCVNI